MTTMSEVVVLTPAERLSTAEAKRDQIASRLDEARAELADLRTAVARERERFIASIASAELDGVDRPSRQSLVDLEAEVPEAADRVEALSRALREADRAVALAKAATLRARAVAWRAETAQCQARMDALTAEIVARQVEIAECAAFIVNHGGPAQVRLENEARQLERENGFDAR